MDGDGDGGWWLVGDMCMHMQYKSFLTGILYTLHTYPKYSYRLNWKVKGMKWFLLMTEIQTMPLEIDVKR